MGLRDLSGEKCRQKTDGEWDCAREVRKRKKTCWIQFRQDMQFTAATGTTNNLMEFNLYYIYFIRA